MIKCSKCGNEIENDNAKFCTECGANLTLQKKKYCMNCGALIEGAKFCPECGTPADSDSLGVEPTNDNFNFSVLNSIVTSQVFDKEGFEVENGVLLKYTGNRRSVTIPGVIEEIYDKVFENNDVVSILTIEEGVKIIGKKAFANCSSLIKVYLPASCDLLYDDVFENTHIKELVLGRNNDYFIKCALSKLAVSYFETSSDAKRFVVENYNGILVKISEIEQEALRLENARLEAIRKREAEILAEKRRVEEEQRRIAEEQRRAEEEQRRIEEEKRRQELIAISIAQREETERRRMQRDLFFHKFRVGNTFEFGRYYYESEELMQSIEWSVMDYNYDEKTITLISKNVLDYQQFYSSEEERGCYWKEWHIWKWLNDYFYNIAFSENEKNNIIPEKTKYYCYSSEKVNVFLPLPDEVDRLVKFLNYKKNKIFASATPYAISKIPTDKYKRLLEYVAYQADEQLKDQFMVFWFLDDPANLFQYRDKRSNKIKTGVRKKGVRPVIKVKADFFK